MCQVHRRGLHRRSKNVLAAFQKGTAILAPLTCRVLQQKFHFSFQSTRPNFVWLEYGQLLHLKYRTCENMRLAQAQTSIQLLGTQSPLNIERNWAVSDKLAHIIVQLHGQRWLHAHYIIYKVIGCCFCHNIDSFLPMFSNLLPWHVIQPTGAELC